MSGAFNADELEAIRTQLPAVQRVAYLNGGTLGPLPQAAIEAIARETEYDTRTRQDDTLWEHLTATQDAARAALADLTGVPATHVALMHSTHEGINEAVWGLALEAGESIVTTDEEHPGLLVPLAHACGRAGAEIRVAPWLDDDAAFVAGVLERVDATTRAVALSHVSWNSGRIAPLRALRDALPDHVRVIVDGAQSAGVLPVDPADGWDAYTVSGQKWTCGPNGSGCLALADPLAFHPTFGAYMHVADWSQYVPTSFVEDARRFESSQEALVPLAGIAASVRWLLDEVGIERVEAHARSLNARARARLLDGGVATGALHGEVHLLCIDVPTGRAAEVALALWQAGILVRPLGEDRIRLSFGCWNTPGEAERCCDALLEQLAQSSPTVPG